MDGQRDKARAKSTFGTPAAGEHSLAGPAGTVPTARCVSRLRRHLARHTNRRTARLEATRGRTAQRRRRRIRGACRNTVLFAVRWPGIGSRSPDRVLAAKRAWTMWSRAPARLPRFHAVHVDKGTLSLRDQVRAEVDASIARRDPPQPHRDAPAPRGATAGTRAHVKQAGSLVAPDRLRFDFAHSAAVTPAELSRDRTDRQRTGAQERRRCRRKSKTRRRPSQAARWPSLGRSTESTSGSSRFQASARNSAAAHTCRPPATSGFSPSSPRAALPPEYAESRPSPDSSR